MRKPWFLVGLICVVGFAAMLFASLAQGGSGDREVVERMLAEAKARRKLPYIRTTAIYGELRDGDALPDYLDAAKSLSQIAGEFGEPIPASERSAMRELVAPVVAALRRATPFKTVGQERHSLSIDDAVLANAVSVACKCLLAEGRDLEAVRVWLDAAAFAAVLEGGHRYSYQLADRALANCWTDAELAALSEDARSQLVAGILWVEDELLEPIDWPQHLAPGGTLVLWPHTFEDKDLFDRLSAWRAGFSPQRAGIREVAAVIENLSAIQIRSDSWTERCQKFEALEAVLAGGSVIGSAMFDFIDRWRRVTIARLRILRIAIALHSGEEFTAIANPLGDGAIPVVRLKGQYVLRVGGDIDDCERIVRK